MTAPAPTAVFTPFAWQVAPWRDKSPVLLLTGSAGGGKSQLAAEKLHGYMLAYPGACGLALRKAREWCAGSVRVMLEAAIGDDPTVHIYDDRIDYDNGSRIYFGGMLDHRQREAIRSKRGKRGDPDIAWLEEANAFTRQDYDEIGGRLRGNVAGWTQIILSTNPDIPQHWIYTDLISGGGAKVYYSGARDNPRNTQAYLDRLDAMVGVLRDRLRDGKWTRAEGVVYDEYDPAIHLIDPFEIPAEWRRIRGIDFGYTNPFVCQWWAIDPDGAMYLYRELVRTRALVEDLTPLILALSEGENISGTVADHDAEDRATMERRGLRTSPAKKEVSVGIQAMKARLKVQPNGKPRLFIMRGSLVDYDSEYAGPQGLENEITAYSWQKLADGKASKEEPLKLYDHSCDTARYAVMHEEHPGWLMSRGAEDDE